MKKYILKHKNKNLEFETGYIMNPDSIWTELLRILGKVYTEENIKTLKENYEIVEVQDGETN